MQALVELQGFYFSCYLQTFLTQTYVIYHYRDYFLYPHLCTLSYLLEMPCQAGVLRHISMGNHYKASNQSCGTCWYCNHRQSGEDIFTAELRSVSSLAPITAITRPLPLSLLLYSRFCSASHLLEMTWQAGVLCHISMENQDKASI